MMITAMTTTVVETKRKTVMQVLKFSMNEWGIMEKLGSNSNKEGGVRTG